MSKLCTVYFTATPLTSKLITRLSAKLPLRVSTCSLALPLTDKPAWLLRITATVPSEVAGLRVTRALSGTRAVRTLLAVKARAAAVRAWSVAAASRLASVLKVASAVRPTSEDSTVYCTATPLTLKLSRLPAAKLPERVSTRDEAVPDTTIRVSAVSMFTAPPLNWGVSVREALAGTTWPTALKTGAVRRVLMALARATASLAWVASVLVPRSAVATVYFTCLPLTLKLSASPAAKLPRKPKMGLVALPETVKRVSLPVSRLTLVAGLRGLSVTPEPAATAWLVALKMTADCCALTRLATPWATLSSVAAALAPMSLACTV